MSGQYPFENPTCIIARKDTDWALCCLCQVKSKKDVRCPYKKECHHDAYQTLENELKKFVEHDISLPLQVSLECLDDGSGIANTLLKNEAKYHNGCRILFRSHIVQRALDKRTRELLDSEEETISKTKPVKC